MNFKLTHWIGISLLSVCFITFDALAQPGRGGGRQGGGMNMMTAGGMTPDYMLRDLQRFQEGLLLTEEQVLIVEQILREYDEAFQEASETSQQSMGEFFRSMRPSEDDPMMQRSQEIRQEMREIREKIGSAESLSEEQDMTEVIENLRAQSQSLREEIEALRAESMDSPQRQAAFENISLIINDQLRFKRKMRSEFESDLVAILTEEQFEFWPPLQRQLIRDRLLPRGRLSGETVDVMSLVEEQSYDDERLLLLLPVLMQWDEDVTRALTARNDHLEQNQASLMSSMTSGDSQSSLDIMKTQADLAVDVRDINNSAVSDIVLMLSDDAGNDFDAVAKERGYSRIYRLTRAQRAFKAAMELEGLEDDILQAIIDLNTAFELELEYANEQIYAATLRWEAQEQVERINRWSSRMRGGNEERPESPIQKAEEDKRNVEDSYISQLRMLLTPEQIEALGGLDVRERNERGRGSWGNWSGGNKREEFMKQFDKNGDGQLTHQELLEGI